MRPFLIPKTRRWIDLDTVQSVLEPYFEDRMGSGGFFVMMTWQHAFREAPCHVSFDVDWKSSEQYVIKLHGGVSVPSFVAPADWKDAPGHEHTPGRFMIPFEGSRPAALAEVHREVFVPFFEAWTGNRYVSPFGGS